MNYIWSDAVYITRDYSKLIYHLYIQTVLLFKRNKNLMKMLFKDNF